MPARFPCHFPTIIPREHRSQLIATGGIASAAANVFPGWPRSQKLKLLLARADSPINFAGRCRSMSINLPGSVIETWIATRRSDQWVGSANVCAGTFVRFSGAASRSLRIHVDEWNATGTFHRAKIKWCKQLWQVHNARPGLFTKCDCPLFRVCVRPDPASGSYKPSFYLQIAQEIDVSARFYLITGNIELQGPRRSIRLREAFDARLSRINDYQMLGNHWGWLWCRVISLKVSGWLLSAPDSGGREYWNLRLEITWNLRMMKRKEIEKEILFKPFTHCASKFFDSYDWVFS